MIIGAATSALGGIRLLLFIPIASRVPMTVEIAVEAKATLANSSPSSGSSDSRAACRTIPVEKPVQAVGKPLVEAEDPGDDRTVEEKVDQPQMGQQPAADRIGSTHAGLALCAPRQPAPGG